MTSLADRIVAVAASQVGVKESPPGTNCNPYAAAIAPKVQGQAWCAVFVSWVFGEVGAPLPPIQPQAVPGGGFAYCPFAVTYAHDNGEIPAYPERGDILLFDWAERDGRRDRVADHVGIFVAINGDGTYSTIEGNTAIGNDSDGGQVMRRVRSKADVTCVWRPAVLADDAKSKDVGTTTEEEDDMATLEFLVGPILPPHPLAGRWCKVKPELADRRLRCEFGAWEDGPGVIQLPQYCTSILQLDDPAIAAGLDHPIDWDTAHVGQSSSDPHVFVITDKDGDYGFKVA